MKRRRKVGRWARQRGRLLATTPMTFGRFAGVPMSRVPHDYLRWLVNRAETDAGTRWLVKNYLHSIGETEADNG